MMTDFQEIVRALRHPAESRRRQALMEIEHSLLPEQLHAFIEFAKRLDRNTAIAISEGLAGTTSPELARLLGDFAGSGDERLRTAAFSALGRVSRPLRMPVLLELLKNPIDAVRARACTMLGDCGSQAPAKELMAALQDPQPQVILAALEALERLEIRQAVQPIRKLLSHPSKDIRLRVLRVLPRLASKKEFPVKEVAHLLEGDESAGVRAAAAHALGAARSPEARDVLLHILRHGKDPDLQATAATALSAYSEFKVLESLIEVAAETHHAPLSLACTRAINRLDAEVALEGCTRILQSKRTPFFLETVAILSELSVPGIPDLLAKELEKESDPLHRAAIVEALGRCGRPEGWASIRARTRDPDPATAYAAVCALADLLDEAHLPDYIALLDELENETIREAALKRLSLFGKARPLPPALWKTLAPLLHSPSRNVRILAVETAGCLRNPKILYGLLASLRGEEDPEYLRAVSDSILQLCEGQIFMILEEEGKSHLRELARVIGRWSSLEGVGSAFCRRLAAFCVEGIDGAEEALFAAAQLEPMSLARAMNESEGKEQEVLITIWNRLPPEARRGTRFDRKTLLASPLAPARLAALEAIDETDGEEILPLLVDLALEDPDEAVRAAARAATRRLVEMALTA